MFETHQKKIKKIHIFLLGAVVLSGIVLRLFQLRTEISEITVEGETLQVMLAKNPKEWYVGLGGRKSLEPFDGMLFLFPFAEKHAFVMRDMHFSIDIVWLLSGEVVDIAPKVPVFPMDRPYLPREEANAVLELPAGESERLGLQIGDKIEFSVQRKP